MNYFTRHTFKKIVGLTFIGAFVFFTAAKSAWTGPTAAPFGGNLPIPLHDSAVDQVKEGGLSVAAFIANGDALFREQVRFKEWINGSGKGSVPEKPLLVFGDPENTKNPVTLSVTGDVSIANTAAKSVLVSGKVAKAENDGITSTLCATDSGTIVLCSDGPGSPTLSVKASPETVKTGVSSAISWTSTNTISCTSPQFDTKNATTNTTGVLVSPTETTTYTVECLGINGKTITQSVVVQFAIPPTVKLGLLKREVKNNAWVSSETYDIDYIDFDLRGKTMGGFNAPLVLWKSTNATTCTGTNFTTGNMTSRTLAMYGTASFGAPFSGYTYPLTAREVPLTISCTGPGGVATDTVLLKLRCAPGYTEDNGDCRIKLHFQADIKGYLDDLDCSWCKMWVLELTPKIISPFTMDFNWGYCQKDGARTTGPVFQLGSSFDKPFCIGFGSDPAYFGYPYLYVDKLPKPRTSAPQKREVQGNKISTWYGMYGAATVDKYTKNGWIPENFSGTHKSSIPELFGGSGVNITEYCYAENGDCVPFFPINKVILYNFRVLDTLSSITVDMNQVDIKIDAGPNAQAAGITFSKDY